MFIVESWGAIFLQFKEHSPLRSNEFSASAICWTVNLLKRRDKLWKLLNLYLIKTPFLSQVWETPSSVQEQCTVCVILASNEGVAIAEPCPCPFHCYISTRDYFSLAGPKLVSMYHPYRVFLNCCPPISFNTLEASTEDYCNCRKHSSHMTDHCYGHQIRHLPMVTCIEDQTFNVFSTSRSLYSPSPLNGLERRLALCFNLWFF